MGGKKGKCDGSITIFLALTLLLILSFLFAMLEAARVQGLETLVYQKGKLDLESAFGAYNGAMWEQYGMLFLDGSAGTGTLDLSLLEGQMMEEARLEELSTGFFQLALKNVEISEYTLATDWGGAAFQEQACTAIQQQLAAGVLDTIWEKQEMGGEMSKKSDELEKNWKMAQDATASAEKYEKEQKEKPDYVPAEKVTQRLPKEQNPINIVKPLKQKGILDMVVEDPNAISQKGIEAEDMVEKRSCYCGNQPAKPQGSVDKLWFVLYLNTYFSCMAGNGEKGSENHALDYELEYCIGGRDKDADNLEETVKKLLAIREVGNFTTLMQDEAKQAVSLELAVGAVGFTGMPPLISAVQVGILLAWSYVESIQDIRCLLAGGTIALVKSPLEWKSDIGNLKQDINQQRQPSQDSGGLSYREYLMILLGMTPRRSLVYRGMNVVEENMRLIDGYGKLRVDTLLNGIKVQEQYVAQPLFLQLITLGKKQGGVYSWNTEQELSY
ncbi:MAG: DUF5702 domain-containing protein [Lachnospiraceae bacterium]